MNKSKGVTLITVITVVAAVILSIVFFTLFKDKNTSALAKSINSYSTSGYLSDKDGSEYKQIDSYLNNLQTKLVLDSAYTNSKNQVITYRDAYKGYICVSAFFNREANFMTYTKYYKDNRKDVQDSLSKAQKSAKNLLSNLKKNKTATGDNSYWADLVWKSCYDDAYDLLKNTINAFNVFAKIYKNSVSSNLLNNDFSDIMFRGLSSLSKIVKNEIKTNINCGGDLFVFTNKYFSLDGESMILRYSYLEDDNQNKIKVVDIKKNWSGTNYNNFISAGLVF